MIQMDVFYVFNRMFSKGHAIYKARTKSQVTTITYLGGVYSAGDLLTIFSSRVELIRGGQFQNLWYRLLHSLITVLNQCYFFIVQCEGI